MFSPYIREAPETRHEKSVHRHDKRQCANETSQLGVSSVSGIDVGMEQRTQGNLDILKEKKNKRETKGDAETKEERKV